MRNRPAQTVAGVLALRGARSWDARAAALRSLAADVDDCADRAGTAADALREEAAAAALAAQQERDRREQARREQERLERERLAQQRR